MLRKICRKIPNIFLNSLIPEVGVHLTIDGISDYMKSGMSKGNLRRRIYDWVSDERLLHCSIYFNIV